MIAWLLVCTMFINKRLAPPPNGDKDKEQEEQGTEGKEKKGDEGDSETVDGGDAEVPDTGETDTGEGPEVEGDDDTSEPEGTSDESELVLFDKGFDKKFKLTEHVPGKRVVYEYQVNNKVTVYKEYTIHPAPGKDEVEGNPEPYLIDLTLRFENRGTEPLFCEDGYFISAGTTSLLTPWSKSRDLSIKVRTGRVRKEKLQSKEFVEEKSDFDHLEWGAVSNRYFTSVLRPLTRETYVIDNKENTKKSAELHKSIGSYVVLGTKPREDGGESDGETGDDSDDSSDEDPTDLQNDYLTAVFRNEEGGTSVPEFILEAGAGTNNVLRGSYDEKGIFRQDRRFVFTPEGVAERFHPFAISPRDLKDEKGENKLKKLNYSLAIGVKGFTVKGGRAVEHKFSLYVGPKEYRRLKKLGLEEVIGFWFVTKPINRLLLGILHWIHSLIPSYGAAILLLTLMLKIILFPLDQKSYKSMKEMQKIQPLIAELKEKYKDDPKQAQLKQMELFREHKVNPLGGCLPMLLQFPVLIAMFTTMRVTFELLGEKFLWISDLSQPDAVMWFPGGGFWIFRSLNILPIVMALTFYFQQHLSSTAPKNPNDPQYQQQQLMGKLFPVLFGFIFYNMPSGLTLYFTFSTFLRIMQQLWVIKQPDDKMGAAQRQ